MAEADIEEGALPEAEDMLVAMKEVLLLEAGTKEVVLPREVPNDQGTQTTDHGLVGIRVENDPPLELVSGEVVRSLIDSEAEPRHSAEYSAEEPLEAIVLNRIVQSSMENERNAQGMRKELMNLPAIETMPEVSRKLGQVERRKIYSDNSPKFSGNFLWKNLDCSQNCIQSKKAFNFLKIFCMKVLFYTFVTLATSFLSQHVFADDNAGILGGIGDSDKLRSGDVSFSDIPKIISYATTFVLGFAATVSVIMIIYGAFQMALFGLTSQEKKKGAETIQHGIIGFVITVSAWFIINIVMSNL